MMKTQKLREIIIEYERVQIIRKRAKTSFEFCAECRSNADFISFVEAATLFNTEAVLLYKFIEDTGSHFQTRTGREIYVCLNSLLAKMKERTNRSSELTNTKVKTIGG